MCATYNQKSKTSNFKSFANTIYTGIKEINPIYAEKRAIWELFQNALDVIEKDGEISIEKTTDGFIFSHNGKPFKDDNLGALIKQYSSGKEYGNNGKEVGQYGTGFLSTHVYGKHIILNGTVQVDDGTYKNLVNFDLNRNFETIDELTKNLLIQDGLAEALCDGNEFIVEYPSGATSFKYLANENNAISIDAMFNYVPTILPFIFCFNEKLQSVKISTNGQVVEYNREKDNGNTLFLTVNNEKIVLDYLCSSDGNVKVVFPQNEFSFQNVPKLFLFYPLMETCDIGINFIIHAQEFKPNKERDFLHRIKTNEQIKKDVEINESLINISFDLILNKLSTDDSEGFLNFCDIIILENDTDVEKELKLKYIKHVIKLKRLNINSSKVSIEDLFFFDESLLLESDEVIRAAYDLFSQFNLVNNFDDFIYLSERVNNWNKYLEDKLEVLKIEDIAQEISTKTSKCYNKINNKESYRVLINALSQNLDLLNNISLIPNIHNELLKFKELVRWEEKEPSLLSIMDEINADGSKKYLHGDFDFLQNTATYKREDFKEEFSKYCTELSDLLIKNINSLSYSRIGQISKVVTRFIGLNNVTELNDKLFDFFYNKFKCEFSREKIDRATVEINYQSAFKLLSRIYVIKVSKNVVENVSDLLELISILDSNKNLKDELLDKLQCFPNQIFELRSQSELAKDLVIDDDLKNMFDKITGDEIRKDLILHEFEKLIHHNNAISGEQLGAKIESTLNHDRKFVPVNETILSKIIEIVKFISNKPATWGIWFPNINAVKEEILMFRFSDESTRGSLFSILNQSPEQIQLLGKLSEIENLEDLILKGKEKQKEENRINNHLNYINKVGLQIQELVDQKLNEELKGRIKIEKSDENSNLIAKEEQNGQDFIIYRDSKPLFFIEVKSKWDENGRFALSKNQTEKSAKEKNKYAVITVNVDRYKREMNKGTEQVSFEELYSYIKVVDNIGEHFEKLVEKNVILEEVKTPKLIEYRGSIPQNYIDIHGEEFNIFINNLINVILGNND